MASREARELVKAVERQRPDLPKIGLDGRGHYVIRDAEGKRLYSFGSTPSDRRWRVNTIKDLLRLKVLKHDPFGDKKEEAVEAATVERPAHRENVALDEARRAKDARTKDVRARLVAFLDQGPYSQADFARHMVVTKEKRPELLQIANTSVAVAGLSVLRNDNKASHQFLDLVEATMTRLQLEDQVEQIQESKPQVEVETAQAGGKTTRATQKKGSESMAVCPICKETLPGNTIGRHTATIHGRNLMALMTKPVEGEGRAARFSEEARKLVLPLIDELGSMEMARQIMRFATEHNRDWIPSTPESMAMTIANLLRGNKVMEKNARLIIAWTRAQKAQAQVEAETTLAAPVEAPVEEVGVQVEKAVETVTEGLRSQDPKVARKAAETILEKARPLIPAEGAATAKQGKSINIEAVLELVARAGLSDPERAAQLGAQLLKQ